MTADRVFPSGVINRFTPPRLGGFTVRSGVRYAVCVLRGLDLVMGVGGAAITSSWHDAHPVLIDGKQIPKTIEDGGYHAGAGKDETVRRRESHVVAHELGHRLTLLQIDARLAVGSGALRTVIHRRTVDELHRITLHPILGVRIDTSEVLFGFPEERLLASLRALSPDGHHVRPIHYTRAHTDLQTLGVTSKWERGSGANARPVETPVLVEYYGHPHRLRRGPQVWRAEFAGGRGIPGAEIVPGRLLNETASR